MIGIVAGCFEQNNYKQWLLHYNLTYRIVSSVVEMDDVDVMIFCGGPDLGVKPQRDALDKDIWQACYERSIPMVGICRGMQEIAYFMGAKLIPDLGELNSVHRTADNHQSRWHDIILSDCTCWRVNSRHHQAVEAPPFECALSAQAEDGTWEMMVSQDKLLFLVQCHPEREEMWGSELEQETRKWLISKIDLDNSNQYNINV